jgi:hypothetical protein
MGNKQNEEQPMQLVNENQLHQNDKPMAIVDKIIALLFLGLDVPRGSR